ncbi:YdcF family protein [Paenibacillus motobuensis]|uniref:YdcF family protein n=1 Tax=Paenibacillus TaxID=44249 RepID=UPI002040C740|nr:MULTISPECIES: YdcF family protein [Paenibacillus]MCM3038674.1 YdcF family protein [Paenibacillus lutimineralis]MCM3645778.1 YdcF family protein [Paenibacillus motobuensis]
MYPFDCITEFMFFETGVDKADVILVPGGSHPQLMERAAELYHRQLAPYILPSGGSNSKLKSTEWEYLREIGLSLGVPQEAILKEDQATNTFENARCSLDVLQSKQANIQKAILVCKSYHARRALLTYQVYFPKETNFYVSPVTDQTGITKENWYLEEHKTIMVMKELTKVGQYFAHHIPNWIKSYVS